MRRRFASIALAALILQACGDGDVPVRPEDPKLITYELLGPRDGTIVRRGQTVDVRLRVVDGPPQLGCSLSMGVEFLHPDGRPDNSYLPGAESANGATPYSIDLAIRFRVPIGTPEGNSFIPPGSRVTVVRPGLYCYEGTSSRGPGIVARYPVVD